ncbi:MAG: hypothetical protein IJE81_00430 [Oscillospiraceae bacterium]|nr:hypothetical protein [Oscillospiraceae bacterium]
MGGFQIGYWAKPLDTVSECLPFAHDGTLLAGSLVSFSKELKEGKEGKETPA